MPTKEKKKRWTPWSPQENLDLLQGYLDYYTEDHIDPSLPVEKWVKKQGKLKPDHTSSNVADRYKRLQRDVSRLERGVISQQTVSKARLAILEAVREIVPRIKEAKRQREEERHPSVPTDDQLVPNVDVLKGINYWYEHILGSVGGERLWDSVLEYLKSNGENKNETQERLKQQYQYIILILSQPGEYPGEYRKLFESMRMHEAKARSLFELVYAIIAPDDVDINLPQWNEQNWAVVNLVWQMDDNVNIVEDWQKTRRCYDTLLMSDLPYLSDIVLMIKKRLLQNVAHSYRHKTLQDFEKFSHQVQPRMSQVISAHTNDSGKPAVLGQFMTVHHLVQSPHSLGRPLSRRYSRVSSASTSITKRCSDGNMTNRFNRLYLSDEEPWTDVASDSESDTDSAFRRMN